MSERIKRIKGLTLKPKTAATTVEGETKVDYTTKTFKVYLDGSERTVVTEDQVQTLTNKTHTDPKLDGDITGTAIDIDVALTANSDTKVASQKAVKAYIDNKDSAQNEASEIKYDATGSGLDTGDANSNVQDSMDDLDANSDALVDLSGVALKATDLGTFTGTTISDASKVKAALQELETAVETKAGSGDLTTHINDATDAHAGSAITNTPSGNLTATTIQGAVDELQTDIDTRALSSDLTTHESDTSTHGVGEIVGTTEIQDLSNKTFVDPITLEELGATPSNPAVGDKKFYAKNDGKIYTLDSSGNEVEVGSGSGGGGSTQFEITQASHGFAVGNGIYHNGTNWVKAQANNANTLAYYAVISVTDVNTFGAADFGRIEALAHGYTIGKFYWLSDSVAGSATNVEPSSGFSNPLFYVEDINTLQIKCLRPDAIAGINLDNLDDVSVPAPTDNQVLAYSNANSRWEAADAVSAAADVTTDNSGNSLTAVDAQASLDEVAARLDVTESNTHNNYANFIEKFESITPTLVNVTKLEDTVTFLPINENKKSIKATFSGSAGSITYEGSIPADLTGNQGVVTVWIKTSVQGLTIDSVQDGATVSSLIIDSNNKWRQYEIATVLNGITVGFKVNAVGAVTGDVYIDEAFAGLVTKSITSPVSQAMFVGSLTYEAVNCIWSSTSTVYAPFPIDADCVATNIIGEVSAPTTKIPAIKILNARTDGYYKVSSQGLMWAGSASTCEATLTSSGVYDSQGITHTDETNSRGSNSYK